MKEIIVVRSANNGLGGVFDKSESKDIFIDTTSNRYTCVYIKNISSVKKRILKLTLTSVDEILIGIQKDLNNDILTNTILPILNLNEDPSNISFNTLVINSVDLILNPNDFFAVWLKLPTSTNLIKSNHTVSFIVDYMEG